MHGLATSSLNEGHQDSWIQQWVLKQNIKCVFGFAFYAFTFAAFFLFFFFFFFHVFSPTAVTVHVRYMNSSRNIWPVFREQYTYVLFTDPQILFFINFFIKNGSHDTIYTFKNYFATVISAISFQFQQNKSYPNRTMIVSLHTCRKHWL